MPVTVKLRCWNTRALEIFTVESIFPQLTNDQWECSKRMFDKMRDTSSERHRTACVSPPGRYYFIILYSFIFTGSNWWCCGGGRSRTTKRKSFGCSTKNGSQITQYVVKYLCKSCCSSHLSRVSAPLPSPLSYFFLSPLFFKLSNFYFITKPPVCDLVLFVLCCCAGGQQYSTGTN